LQQLSREIIDLDDELSGLREEGRLDEAAVQVQ
jgi:hypothetical protein